MFKLLVDILNKEYFQILTAYSMHVMFYLDTSIQIGGSGGPSRLSLTDTEGDWTSENEEEGLGTVVVTPGRGIKSSISIFMSIISGLSLFGFDQVTALSEEAINETFIAMFKASQKTTADRRIDLWKSEGEFSATFSRISVRLLSDKKALVTVYVEGGTVYMEKYVRLMVSYLMPLI